MRYIKMLESLMVAAVVLAAFAASASATTLTSSSGTMNVGSTVDLTSTNWQMHGSFITINCNHSVMKGTLGRNGSGNALVNLDEFYFAGCNYKTEGVNAGSIEIDSAGTVRSAGATIVAHTSVGECGYTTNLTDIGTLTDSDDTKGNAILDLNSASIPRTKGSFFCGSAGTWTGNYTVIEPSTLYID